MGYQLPSRLPFSKKKLPKKVVISYILDYVILIVLFIAVYALDAIEPFHQHFSLQNYTLQYPFAVHERVPLALLFFVAVICPIIIIVIYTLAIDGLLSSRRQQLSTSDGSRTRGEGYRLKDRLWELNCGVLGLLLASSAAYVITGVLKNATGKPRPDLIDRCRPVAGSADLPVFGLSNSTICSQTDHAILKDGFRSFPSGHSSTSWAGLFYLSLYLAGKLHVLDNRGEVWKPFVVLAPTLGAALIAISRIMDARHHPFDVISGSLLGLLVAYAAYRQYFPSLEDSWRKGRAYHIRSWATEPTAPHPDEREVARDKGVEPLRSGLIHPDEEQPKVTFAVPGLSGPGSDADPEGNVFRKQISESQRRRDEEIEARRTGPSSSYSRDFDPRKPSSTFGSRRGHSRDADGYWSSSSSEHDGNEDGLELQPQYTLTHPPARTGSKQDTGYRSAAEDDEEDTSYRPREHNPSFAPSSAYVPLGNPTPASIIDPEGVRTEQSI